MLSQNDEGVSATGYAFLKIILSVQPVDPTSPTNLNVRAAMMTHRLAALLQSDLME